MSTPKQISNRIKAKGLQKLRWYCQMCSKSCRDANGFKCHLNSESHQRQLLVFAQSSGKFIDDFSDEFHKSFMEVLRRRGRQRILANKLYNEVISERHHTHMNSTKWGSLTAYVQFLGAEGLAEVDDSEQGLYVTYVDQAPDAKRRAERRRALERAEARDAQRADRALRRSLRDAPDAPAAAPEPRALPAGAAPVGFALADAPPAKRRALPALFAADDEPEEVEAKEAGAKAEGAQARLKAAEERRAEERRAEREGARRKANWLKTGIVVKVKNRELADGAYHRKKGVVVALVDKFTAELEMQKSGDVLRLDQSDLETVLPSVGGSLLILNGAHRGELATLDSVDIDNFCATVKLESTGELVDKVDYGDICKLAKSSK